MQEKAIKIYADLLFITRTQYEIGSADLEILSSISANALTLVRARTTLFDISQSDFGLLKGRCLKMDTNIKEELSLLNKLYKEQQDIYHSYSSKIGIPETVFWILYCIYTFEQPCTQQDLCAEMLITKQTVNSAVKNLEKNGVLVLRKAEETSSKKKYLELTGKGLKFCRESIEPLLMAEEQAFTKMTDRERKSFLTLTKKQNDLLKEHVEHLQLK